jgi:hypothetical protein
MIVMSVCPSVGIEQLGWHWANFHENLYMSIFLKYVEKIQVSLKSDKNTATSGGDQRKFTSGEDQRKFTSGEDQRKFMILSQ